MLRAGIMLLLAGAVLLGACGGGGDETALAPTPAAPPPAAPPPAPPPTIAYTAGSFLPSSTFAAQCETPRTGTNPATGRAYPDIRGSALAEKHFLRAWTHELYLWFNEVVDRDPASVAGIGSYFDLLKTTALRPSGRQKDEFHFTYDSADYYALSQSGTAVDYGIRWAVLRATPPRRLVVQFVQQGSPAAVAGITRGAELLSLDGVDVVSDGGSAAVQSINAALFPATSGAAHAFVFRERGGATRSVTLAARAVTYAPVPVVRVLQTPSSAKVGYLLFNDHVATAEQALVGAINQLRTENVSDLVLDLRYNGGGYLDIASGLAYMIAGPVYTAGKAFERVQFSSKHPSTNPVTGEPLQPLPFHTRTQFGGSATLPTLNLPRVYVLTSAETCSASESVINGLRGAGVQVHQIGGVTCGKPYGFYPRDNCGTTYFSIQFQGVNELGFGDYAEGFAPYARSGADARAQLPGCSAADDLTRDLGDPLEGQLQAALQYRETGQCTALATLVSPATTPAGEGRGAALQIPAEPWRDNRILR